MNDLIKALKIFRKYGNPYAPTHCGHDILYIGLDITPEEMDETDVKTLDKLSFNYSEEYEKFYSFRFGSC